MAVADHQGNDGHLKLPFEVYDEIASGNDELARWIASDGRSALIAEAEVDRAVFNRVLTEGYASDLNDTELEKIGRDAFLIAYGVMGAPDCTIVTREVSKPTATRSNRKVPDVCDQFGVPWITDFQLWRVLDFRVT